MPLEGKRWGGSAPAFVGSLWILALTLLGIGSGWADAERWLLVDTQALELRVMRNGQTEHSFTDIAIGRYGTTTSKHRRDNKTPLGTFRIVRVSTDSPFRLFLGLNYPNRDHADRAHETGRLGDADWKAIRNALRSHREPPQNTPLGGYIGIHGIGDGDIAIHRQFNWTNGCIALTNEEIVVLGGLVAVGTRVVIK